MGAFVFGIIFLFFAFFSLTSNEHNVVDFICDRRFLSDALLTYHQHVCLQKRRITPPRHQKMLQQWLKLHFVEI